ncbi:acetoin dehydrogenase dihydrolipoyllysine-residue acetyltransferase subunit [Ruegeria pomeroyi]|jgi:pyruvate dehydrogenase E2 component (dihydrolipoamide acetyltransferase)|uniref:Acetoin dehydrogenase complex, E2 component, dihydrolipoamide acetyltransferase n=2 Tax=Ruegeria pomeroyi TaxID=89184 RepID=Q5LLX5_RUEPO|nr:acetoin dehydrogenase dihydrolipoyllysine-residue acetyltransferase subunit [Ruegeria pomeroyi]AAV97010.1 acetoin dehydrogenase complex, E2 component, dihydrolipoamide acetyltransferase [Ruegeria pomeroyi DSS-3]NVK99162.1 acetoin dehydrogenase dihydrolipoyllysine-residue acetyltransferase subunit [Ruegeria pomeroyi]NVL03682.1 acetoin dehydrogenase dihydrolipoyllysine-residue acetyltransferase subunit [Ruegeria pomeroyi]QWV10536.1 acetoin dehydrogenase dihydrolipoyllysine-residue acetyltransf
MSDLITPILMPKWGLSMREGTLAAWHVEEGTEISPGDEIMDVETDKIANVVEAADGGLLRRRVGQAGEVYPVRALLGVLAPESVSDAEVDAYVDAFEMPQIEEEEDTGPAHEFADLGVGRIRYITREGEGVPVILIHGFGGDLDNWLFNIDALAEKAPVHALDLPGHGQSVKTVDDPGLGTMVDAVVQLMDHLNIDKAHLVGHSMGGLVSGQVAIEHPGRVASLSLICSAGLGDEINAGYIDGFVGAASRRDLKPVLKDLFADQSLVSRAMVDDLLKYKRLDGVQSFLEALRGNLFAGGRQAAGIAAALAGFNGPIQVIWGADDAVIPQSHANAIADASVTVVEGAGHMVQMENASRVNELISHHL